MDFRKIFNSYSSSSDISDRTDVLAQLKSPPGDISFKINEFINSVAPNTLLNNIEDSIDNISDPVADLTSDKKKSDLSDDIMNALSDLDIDDIDTPELSNDTTNDNDILSNLSDKDQNIVESETVNDRDVLKDNTNILTNNEEFSESVVDPILTAESDQNNTTNSLSQERDNDLDLDLDDLLDNETGSSSFSEDDFDDISFNDELTEDNDDFSLDDNDFEFGIEDPDELINEQQIIVDKKDDDIIDHVDNIEHEELELPDFSNTEITQEKEIPDFTPEILTPTMYEQSTDKEDLDSWSNWNTQEKNNLAAVSSLDLSEHQIFSIRQKINQLSNRDTRSSIRNILLDPLFHKEYIDQLISLLLINAPEEKIEEFLAEKNQDHNFDENLIDPMEENSFATFFADDVLRFEQFKEEFTKTLQKVAIFGFLSLILGFIAWFGLAQPLRVNSIFEKGLVAIKNNEFATGESLFNQAHHIAGTPIPKWFVAYGDAYAEKKMIKSAEQKYISGINFAPKDIAMSSHVADFYTNLGQNYYPPAIDIMKNISLLHPKNFEVWDYYGNLHIDYADFFSKDPAKAQELYFKAANIYNEFIKSNPKNIAPYYKMIDIYIKLKNPRQIDTIAQLIYEANPKYLNLDILNKLANYYTNKRDLNASAKIFKQMVPFLDAYIRKIPDLQSILKKTYNINPQNVSNLLSESYYQVARYRMLSSDILGANTVLTNSIILNPNNDHSYNLLGESLLVTGAGSVDLLNEAELLFKKALEINPNAYKPHINLGHLNYYWGGEMPTPANTESIALYHYNTAKQLMPQNQLNYLLNYNLAWLEHKNNNDNDALDLLSDIYKINPNNPTLNYAMGSILYKIGNPQLSQVKFQEATKILEDFRKNIFEIKYENPRHREIFTQLAKIYNNIGVINANYGRANPKRADYFNSQALLQFYESKNIADQIGSIYNMAEYNIGVLTRSNIRNRSTVFDESIPKQTTIEPLQSEFKKNILEKI
ncbi:MAG: periplasmic flagellar collar protein FlcA [Brevinema sp.]